MQQAGQFTAVGHIKAMQVTRPNRFEYEIESEILHEFNRQKVTDFVLFLRGIS